MKNYKIMIFNGLILIILGIYGYMTADQKSLNAFIGPGIGTILLILSIPTRNDKSVFAQIAVVLTLLTVITFFIVGFKRNNNIVIISGVISLVCLMFYIADFVNRKKERNSEANDE